MTRWTRPAVLMSVPVVAAGVLLQVLLGSGRSFAVDRSVTITSPAPMTVVATPLDVRWQGTLRNGQRWALFVDTPVLAAGENLRHFATDTCKRNPTCQPDVDYLAGLGVYVTASNEATVLSLQKLSGANRRQAHAVHTATLVRIDADGRRDGESSWQVQFRE
jgi:hypothetical protein